MGWKTLTLDKAFWFQEGPGVRKWQFRNAGVKLLNVSNIISDGQIDLSKTERCLEPDEAYGKYKHFLVDEGDLVIASSGISIDDDGLLRTRGSFIKKEHLPLCMNTSTIRFKAVDGLSDLSFLRHWLQSAEFRRQITREVTGIAQKNFGPSHLSRIKINLPPLPEQKRIAAILDKADAIRRKREKAIELTDSFLRSVFLEMFGDPRTNPRGWDSDLLGNLARFMGGGTPTTSEERYWNGDIPWVSPKDMKSTFISNSIDKITKEAVEQSATQLIPQGSVLVVNRSGILKKKLPLGINSVPVAINQDLKAMVPSSRLLSNFLLFQLTILSPTILKTVRATTADNIGTDVFKKLSLLVPPIEKQALFSQVVERHRQLCEKLVLSLTSIETLTGSLSQRLFNLPKEQTKISSMQSQEVAHAL